MKRLLTVLAVVAVVAAITVAMVAPAFAEGKITYFQCAPPGGLGETEYAFTKQRAKQYERQGYDCVKVN